MCVPHQDKDMQTKHAHLSVNKSLLELNKAKGRLEAGEDKFKAKQAKWFKL